MTARRALVVDDSRSARAFLTRLLERYELAVDEVESAEQAIEYLNHERPDVIFMDHLMPGMDGFQAVQAIKNNPLTATIPIMMYTSQEGELYLSQARALGALGVLPKQTKHADVSKALEQLRLIGEPRADGDLMLDYPEIFAEAEAETVKVRSPGGVRAGAGRNAFTEDTADIEVPGAHAAAAATLPRVGAPADIAASAADDAAASGAAAAATGSPAVAASSSAGIAAAAAARRDVPLQERRGVNRPNLPAMPPELRAIVEAMVAHHMRNLQRFIAENLETQSDRMVGDVRLMLKDQPPPSVPILPPPEPQRSSGGFWLGVLGLLLAMVAGWQWYSQRIESATLSAQLTQAQQDLQLLRAQMGSSPGVPMNAAAAGNASAAMSPADAPQAADHSILEPVPYGELPLAGSRLERIQSLLARLNAQGFKGTVEIRAIPGRFCMLSGSSATPMLAADVVPFAKCDQVGNPREDNGSISARQSIAFANMIAAARQSSNGKLDIQIGSGGSDETLIPYPPVSDNLTAGEWNRAAAANNRVEVHWQANR
ncbi:MAG: response regulator [Steroidobacteraceae bacterium]